MNCQCCDHEQERLDDSDWYCPNCEKLYVPEYKPELYNEDYRDCYIKYADSEENDPIQQIRWDLVSKYMSWGRVLDVGCGTGAFLDAAPQEFTAYGEELSPHCVAHCDRLDLNVTQSSRTDAYDIVTMFDVIEHFPTLSDVVKRLRHTLLVNGGYFIFSTPNFRPELLDNIKEWRHYKPGEHIHLFSKKSIRIWAERNWMELLEINMDESKIRQPDGNITSYVLRI